MPPATPRTTRTAASGRGRGGLGRRLDRQEPRVDLAQRDRQRLLLVTRLDERADVLEQALVELGVVGVDLTRALCGVDDERVLRVSLLEQLVDRRVGDALRDRKSTRLNSSHVKISYAVFCL